MIDFNDKDFVNLDDFEPIPQHVIDAENAAEYARAKIEAEHKINKVMQYIQANNKSADVRGIVEKFNLDWALEKEFDNGIGRIGFYTDESQRFLVMELYLPVNEWFR